jgi:hypothetical protein
MVDAKSVLEILDFLRVSRKQRAKIVPMEDVESVKALYSLHQIRYQALNLNMSREIFRSRKVVSSSQDL